MGKKRFGMAAVLLAAVTLCTFYLPVASPALAHWSHGGITERGLAGDGFTSDAMDEINRANSAQDSGSNGDDLRRHFLRSVGAQTSAEAFKAAKEYINDELKLIDKLMEGSPPHPDNVQRALQAYGRIIHTMQDLPCHTDYMQLTEEQKQQVLEATLNCTLPKPQGLTLMAWATLGKEVIQKVFPKYTNDYDSYSHESNNKDDDADAIAVSENLTRWTEQVLQKRLGAKKDVMKKWRRPAIDPRKRSPYRGHLEGHEPYRFVPPKELDGAEPGVLLLVSDNTPDLCFAVAMADQFGFSLSVTARGSYNEKIISRVSAMEPQAVLVIGSEKDVIPKYRELLQQKEIPCQVFGGSSQDISLGIFELFNGEFWCQQPVICDPSNPVLASNTVPVYAENVPELAKRLAGDKMGSFAVVSDYGTAGKVADAAIGQGIPVAVGHMEQSPEVAQALTKRIMQLGQYGFLPPQTVSKAVNEYLEPIESIMVPQVIETYPEDKAAAVPVDGNIEIAFFLPMDEASVEKAVTITPPVAFSAAWFENVLILAPDKLDPGTTYTVMVGPGARDLNGAAMSGPYQFSFTTEKGTNWLLVVGIAAAVIVIAGLVLILWRKKKADTRGANP